MALGASQGATLAKAVVPHSRLPSRLSGITVAVSLPLLTALLAVINQLSASLYGTLASVCVLGMVSVWLPFDATVRARLAPKRARVVASFMQRDAAAILRPEKAVAVVRAIVRRKRLSSVWMLLAVVFLLLYIGVQSATSLVTEQFYELLAEGRTLAFVLPIMMTTFELVAKTYLAQVFYADAACIAVTQIFSAEREDDATTVDDRIRELAAVADALHAHGKAATPKRKHDRKRARGPVQSLAIGAASGAASLERVESSAVI